MKSAGLVLLILGFLSSCAGVRDPSGKLARHEQAAFKEVEFLLDALMSPASERRGLITFERSERNDIERIHWEMDRLRARKDKPLRIIWFKKTLPLVFEWDVQYKRLSFVSSDLLPTDFLLHIENDDDATATHIGLGHWNFSVDRKRGILRFDGFLIIDPPTRMALR